MTRPTFASLPPAPVPIYQSLVEFGALWEHAAALDARRVVEIGSLYGGTLWYWLQLPDVEQVISVDLLTDWSPIVDDVRAARDRWGTWHRDLFATRGRAGPRLLVLERNSHDPETVAAVLVQARRDLRIDAALGDLIDVLFIDGDHDDPKRDFGLWSPLVRPGGVVAFHDTVPTGDRSEPAVVECVAELKDWYCSTEWRDPANGAGITAFTMPGGHE